MNAIVTVAPAFSLAGKADAAVLVAGFNDANNGNGYFDRAVAWIKDTGSKMDTVIHAAAVYALMQCREHDNGGHRNTDPIKRLMTAMPKSVRGKTLCDWFNAFGGGMVVSFDKKKQAWKVFLPTSDKREAVDVDAAMAKPFYSVEEKTAGPAAFNLAKAIDNLLKNASKDGVTLSLADQSVIAAIRAERSRLPDAVAA